MLVIFDFPFVQMQASGLLWNRTNISPPPFLLFLRGLGTNGPRVRITTTQAPFVETRPTAKFKPGPDLKIALLDSPHPQERTHSQIFAFMDALKILQDHAGHGALTACRSIVSPGLATSEPITFQVLASTLNAYCFFE